MNEQPIPEFVIDLEKSLSEKEKVTSRNLRSVALYKPERDGEPPLEYEIIYVEHDEKDKATYPICHEKFQDYPSRNQHYLTSCSQTNKTRSKAIKNEKPSLEYEIYIKEDSPDEDKPTCQVCQKTFIDYPSRNRHLTSAHNTEKDEKPQPEFVIDVEHEYLKKGKATCRKKLKSQGMRSAIQRKCTTNYSRCQLLRSARKVENRSSQANTAEKPPPSDDSNTIPCQESNCNWKFPFVQDLRNHLVIDHDFELLNEVKFLFSSLQEFEGWKKELEENTQSRWFKHHTKTFKLHRVFVYDCFNMQKNRNQGESSAHCTSQIIVKAFKGRKERLEVSYFEGHYGHDPLKWKKKNTSQPNKRKRESSGSGEDHPKVEGSGKQCRLCNKTFVNQMIRNQHVKNYHKKEKVPENAKGPIECLEPNCGKKFRLRRFLRQHLISEHNFEMNTGDLFRFSTLEEFENWKSKLEEETQSFYKKRQRDTNKTYKLTIHYVCCRAGKMFNTDNRKRSLKIQGSRRSNIHCTSEIKLRYLDEGYEVVYFKDHYGHDNSLIHLPVPKKVKQEIAEKLMAGLPVRAILRELRLSSGDRLNRKHLIRKKDVDNIKAAYGIKTPRMVSHSVTNDVRNIDTWVKATKSSFAGVIIFYKPEGGYLEELEETDFVVVCMTPFQRKMAAKFGGDRICVDSTCDDELALGTKHVCELTTILVVNDYEEAIPVAFCLSSRVNMPILRLFFCSVRDEIGRIQSHTFVAIEDPQFHNAWCQIMGTPPCHVMCTWHIDASWKLKLGRIVNKNKRLWIYERLKACQLQCDINEFTEMFESLLYELGLSEDTKEFGLYMNKYYTDRPEMWANAHRIGIKINTNLYLDNFHRIIRRNFMSGREKHRIDKCISAINYYILDREYDQLVEYCRGKVLTKMNDIMSRHEAGIAMVSSVSAIIDFSCWAVSSSSQDLIYVVNRVENHNCDSSCAISCERCIACLKGYTCSCDDNAIKGNVCQHLHAVAEYQKSSEDAIQYIVIEGNDDLLVDQGEVMIEQGLENRLKVGKCVQVISEDDQIIYEDDQIIDEDDHIIDENDQIIDEHDQIIDEDDHIIDNDDQIIEEDDCDQIIDEEDDQIIDEDDDQIIDEYDDDQLIKYEHAENDGSCGPVAEVSSIKDSESKDDLVSTALQLMGDLAAFEDVPESVSDQVKKHIEMARKLLRESLATSTSKA